MNFIDYCIATKNYSALKCISNYTKIFSVANPITKAILHSSPEDILVGGASGIAGAVGAGALWGKIQRDRIKKGKKRIDDKYLPLTLAGGATVGAATPFMIKRAVDDNWDNKSSFDFSDE